MPGRHGPPMVEKFLPTVMGSMVEFHMASGQNSLRVYITGETLMFDDLREIPRRYPEIDLALLHLGGTEIMGILLTMDAEQGIETIRLRNPREAIPIHYNDYEVFKSPLEDFKKAVSAAALDNVMRYLQHGETYHFRTSRGTEAVTLHEQTTPL
jgi:L-ascorbate metabolism protein UlaG (beta-lactamase superfamily)